MFSPSPEIYNPKDDSLHLAAIDFNNSENDCCYVEIWCAEIYIESLVSHFSTGRTTDVPLPEAEYSKGDPYLRRTEQTSC
ncbi:hypothetical protein KY290_038375 [Solanum tuberosum]|uniref:Uncharacterized protein n=1 Tax=Solanum tuberosum TaxID=4113 RepID=A0ABQ7U1Z7_SOLTU|nr:hypothetical protein KY290_038375 [Solanum tuberosum]